jgi:prepilin-type processing-associated H-X9-DG protein
LVEYHSHREQITNSAPAAICAEEFQMSQQSTTDGGRGQFTIVQLLVVIGMIAVLLAITGPIILDGNRAARDQNCANNLVQIGKAYVRAMKVTNSQMAIDENWFRNVDSYLEDDARIFHCPEHEGPGVTDTTVSYGMNNRANLLRSGDKIVLLDYKRTVANYVGPPAENWREIYDDWPSLNAPRHSGKMNVLFRDGRVKPCAQDEIDPIVCFSYGKYWKPARTTGLNRQCDNIME